MTQAVDIRVRRAQRGDRRAFEELVAEHHSRIYHSCLRMMASPEDAMDMTQEALLKIWRSLPTFKGDSSLSTWMYRIAMNTCLDELRRRKKNRQVSIDALAEEGWEPTDPEGERLLVRTIDRDLLLRAMERLPEDYRSVFVLRDVQGQSYEEIAAILSVPLGTVRSRLSRSRKLLAKILLELEPNFLDSV